MEKMNFLLMLLAFPALQDRLYFWQTSAHT